MIKIRSYIDITHITELCIYSYFIIHKYQPDIIGVQPILFLSAPFFNNLVSVYLLKQDYCIFLILISALFTISNSTILVCPNAEANLLQLI